MDLTELARVKRELDLTTSAKDTLIGEIITSVSQDVEKFLNRFVKEEARVEQYDVEPGATKIWLRAYPVLAAPAIVIKNDTARQFTSVIEIDAGSFYLNLVRGMLDFDLIRLVQGPGVLQVSYTGGMAVDTAAFIVKFPGIATAVDRQCVFLYKRRDNIGLSSFSAEGGSISLDNPEGFIASVKRVLEQYRRKVAGVGSS